MSEISKSKLALRRWCALKVARLAAGTRVIVVSHTVRTEEAVGGGSGGKGREGRCWKPFKVKFVELQ